MPNDRNLTSAIGKAELQRQQQIEERRRRLEERAREQAAEANAAATPVIPFAPSSPTDRTTGPRPTGQEPTVGPQPVGEESTAGFSDPLRSVFPTADPRPTVGQGPTGERPVGQQPTGHEPTPPVIEFKKGELRIPNSIVFNLYPMLTTGQRVVFEELYLWTVGFGENPRVISQKKIQARLSTDDKWLTKRINELAEKGLVRRIGSVYHGKRAERGTWFEVVLPSTVGQQPTGQEPTARRRPTVGQEPTVGREPDMKLNPKERHERPSVYELRTIAARLFEVHRGEPDFDHERLRALVQDALIGQGQSADAAAIEEAIRGMVV